jgi:hypothetical protein
MDTGVFSDSWDEKTHRRAFSKKLGGDKLIENATKRGAKLIRFECINDPEFEFDHNTYLIIAKNE